MSTREEIAAFMAQTFPDSPSTIEEAAPKSATIRQAPEHHGLRPGDSVSGPTLMALADTALYVAIHATLGITPQAVTSNMNINFLSRPPSGRALVAQCRLLRVGRTLIVGEVSIFSEGVEDPVAHVVGSYSIPRERSQPAA